MGSKGIDGESEVMVVECALFAKGMKSRGRGEGSGTSWYLMGFDCCGADVPVGRQGQINSQSHAAVEEKTYDEASGLMRELSERCRSEAKRSKTESDGELERKSTEPGRVKH